LGYDSGRPGRVRRVADRPLAEDIKRAWKGMGRNMKKESKKLTREERAHEYQLKTITGMSQQKDEVNALGYFSHMRATTIELPTGLTPKQALEIMTNGDCGEP